MDASGHGNGSLDTQLLIDGKAVKGQGGSETIVSPATGKKVVSVPSGNRGQLDQAVKAAQRAFEGWSQSTPQQRSLLLLKLAQAIKRGRRQQVNSGKIEEATLRDLFIGHRVAVRQPLHVRPVFLQGRRRRRIASQDDRPAQRP